MHLQTENMKVVLLFYSCAVCMQVSGCVQVQPIALGFFASVLLAVLSDTPWAVSSNIVPFFKRETLRFFEGWRKRKSTESQIIDIVATGNFWNNIETLSKQSC